jgi:PBP1b-binding outer membrane lipoprotein LpoB
MLRYILTILAILFLTACNNSQDKTASTKDRLGLLPEPDKELRERYEAEQKLKMIGCIFLNPDTSLLKIKLRDSESAETIINDKEKIDKNDQYANLLCFI